MQSSAFYVAAHFAVAVAYLAFAASCWADLRRGGDVQPQGPLRLLLPLALLGHGILLAQEVFGEGGVRFGFAQASSASFLAACALLWIEGFFISLGALYVLMTPLAAVAMLMPLAFHGIAEGWSVALGVHVVVSVLSYSFFTIAALLSVLMAYVARYLRQPGRDASRSIGTLLSQMPSLLALESLLFHQLAAGFVLLTASLGSGIVFSEELFGRPLRFDHKTVFALIAWGVFAGLLTGRFAFGWRGKVAQRWIFVGFLMLLLAYIGSRFVFEVVLRRGWI